MFDICDVFPIPDPKYPVKFRPGETTLIFFPVFGPERFQFPIPSRLSLTWKLKFSTNNGWEYESFIIARIASNVIVIITLIFELLLSIYLFLVFLF